MIERDISKRWETGLPHHPNSIALFKDISAIDYKYGNDTLCWKSGGDGDNGEYLMYALDIYYECKAAGEEI
jgi:hypothetical protein